MTISIRAFADELEKLAIERSLAKDFLAGVDPTGTKTFEYGLQDADQANNLRRAVGTAGGLIGGGLLISSAVSSIVGGARGFAAGGLRGAATGFGKGLVAPIRSPIHALRTRGALRGLKAGKSITEKQLQAMRSLSKGSLGEQTFDRMSQAAEVAGEAGAAVQAGRLKDKAKGVDMLADILPKSWSEGLGIGGGNAARRAQQAEHAANLVEKAPKAFSSPQAMTDLLKEVPEHLRDKGDKLLSQEINKYLSGIGFSAGVGAGSAALQYGKGARTGQIMTPQQRQQIVGDTPTAKLKKPAMKPTAKRKLSPSA